MSHQLSIEFHCLKSKYAVLMLDRFFACTCSKMMIHSFLSARTRKTKNTIREVDASLTMIVLTVVLPLINQVHCGVVIQTQKNVVWNPKKYKKASGKCDKENSIVHKFYLSQTSS